MAPEARVEFLRVDDGHSVAARGVGIRTKVTDIGDPLLLVDDQVVNHVQVLGARLPSEILGGVPIGAAVIHMNVQVGAAPFAE